MTTRTTTTTEVLNGSKTFEFLGRAVYVIDDIITEFNRPINSLTHKNAERESVMDAGKAKS